MNTLVTGGAGFIGSHLVDRLLADGHKVTVLDNFATGRRENLKQHAKNPAFRLVEADVTDMQSVTPHFHAVDWVFHLAALADIVPSIDRPQDYFRTNVDGTLAVLEASRKAQVRRFIYAASSSCYGIPDSYPTAETAEIRCMYPYALTKYLGECLVLHWAKTYKFPTLSLRLFNVYGPRSRTSGTYGAVFGVFLAQKLSGLPFTVVGTGMQKRDFIFVSDTVNAFMRAASSATAGEALNVGSGKPQSVTHLVSLLGGKTVHIPKRPGEPESTHADTAKIRRLLGWKPRVSFEEGVRQIMECMEDFRGAPVWTPETIEKATKIWFTHLAA